MRPLSLVAVGIALVVLDFRTESVDLVPDPIGWVLIGIGAGWLGLTAARWLAWAVAALSVSDLFLPFRYVHPGPTGNLVPTSRNTSDAHLVYLPVHGWQLAGMTAAMVLGAVTLWMILGPLARRAADAGDEAGARRMRLAAAALVFLWAVPFLVTVVAAVVHDHAVYDAVWNDGENYLGMIGTVAAGYAVWLIARARNASWALRPQQWVAARWDLGGQGRSTSQ